MEDVFPFAMNFPCSGRLVAEFFQENWRDDMVNLPPTVNYEQLASAFSNNLEAFRGRGTEFGEKAQVGEGMSMAELIAFISSGMKVLDDAQREKGMFVSVDDRTGSLLQTFLARQAAENPGNMVDGPNGPEAKFDPNDILGWAGSLFTWLKGLKKHSFIAHRDSPANLNARHRMALLSDWGTGMYGAPICADSIQKDKKRFDMLLHLGDVYYAGDISEVEARFLKLWPKVDGAVSRALNSNHEMYSGGYGYFDRILPAFEQEASYFACHNDYWLLVGLDTGYDEHDLHGEQAEWLIDLVRGAGDRRVVLFSHHQPFSLFERQGEKILTKIGKLLDNQKIFAWYWGHEHRCALYDKHPIWNMHGRCIGHSGFPYFRDAFKDSALQTPGWLRREGKNLVPGCEVLDGPNPYIPNNGTEYGPNGYVVLEFSDRELTEIICDADGTELRRGLLA
jgi:hypothetical protein